MQRALPERLGHEPRAVKAGGPMPGGLKTRTCHLRERHAHELPSLRGRLVAGTEPADEGVGHGVKVAALAVISARRARGEGVRPLVLTCEGVEHGVPEGLDVGAAVDVPLNEVVGQAVHATEIADRQPEAQ